MSVLTPSYKWFMEQAALQKKRTRKFLAYVKDKSEKAREKEEKLEE